MTQLPGSSHCIRSELPECIAVETRAGLPAYLDWIRAQTREDTD
jgi:uncharacterized protein involved in tolerance to divalent cations